MQFLQGRQELARWALRTAPKALLGFAVVAEKRVEARYPWLHQRGRT